MALDESGAYPTDEGLLVTFERQADGTGILIGTDQSSSSAIDEVKRIYTAEGKLRSIEIVFDDGKRHLTEAAGPPASPWGETVWEHTEYSPAGEVVSHSFGTTLGATGQAVIVTWERAVDGNGEPTGEWQQEVEAYDPNQPEPDEMTAAQIGEIFGSQLASLIAGSNPFAQVLAGSALATVLGNIGGAIAWFNGDPADDGDGDGDSPGTLTEEIEDLQLPVFSDFFTILKSRATGALSSFLAAELGEALGLEGFGGQLFTTVASSTIGDVLNIGGRAECGVQRPLPGLGTRGKGGSVHSGGRPSAPYGRGLAGRRRLSERSWPQAARMSRPRGVRTGLA
jgi:hypothetical protein